LMDLEYGKVVDEWTVDENTHVNDVVPDSKYAQLTHSQTMIGINDKAMFQLDGRLAGNKMISGTLSQYKTKVGLSAATTTGKGNTILIIGQIAVGSDKGEIRLFDRLGLSRAKTTLPGVGDPILGMDSTER
jgi:VID27 C-terminal WD40-like domain